MRSSFQLYQNLQKEHMGIRSRRMSVGNRNIGVHALSGVAAASEG